jgi:hypothetical protein
MHALMLASSAQSHDTTAAARLSKTTLNVSRAPAHDADELGFGNASAVGMLLARFQAQLKALC